MSHQSKAEQIISQMHKVVLGTTGFLFTSMTELSETLDKHMIASDEHIKNTSDCLELLALSKKVNQYSEILVHCNKLIGVCREVVRHDQKKELYLKVNNLNN